MGVKVTKAQAVPALVVATPVTKRGTAVKTCQELGTRPGDERCPDARGSSMAVVPSSHELAPSRPGPSPAPTDEALAC